MDFKNREVRRDICAAGAKLFVLLPYSPDFNPIEQVFAKPKTLLRKSAERWIRIGKLLDEFKPAECANYLRISGYEPDPTCSSSLLKNLLPFLGWR